VLRIIAIWDKRKFIVALAAGLWGINVSCLSQGIARIRSGWDEEQNFCVILNAESNKFTIIVMFVTDVVLLLTMVVGLFRLRYHGGDTFELGRLLWRQGVIWLLLGTAAELTPVLFICLYLNDALNIMFIMPSLLTMSIAATRMYRSLTDFGSSISISIDAAHVSDGAPTSDQMASGTKRSSTVPTPPNRMEVNVRVAHDFNPYLTPQPSRCVSFLDMDGPLGERQPKPSFDGDLESGGETNPMAKPLIRNY